MEGRRDDSVSAATEDAKTRASSVTADARRVAEHQGDTWRHSLLSSVDHVAEAMDAAAASLRDNEPRLAGAVDDLSRHVKRFASSGHDKSFDELRGDLERVARNNPTLFMAGCVALGVGLSRVLKSTPPEHRGHGASHAHGGTSAGTGAATTPMGQPDRPSAASGTAPSPAGGPAAVPGSVAPNSGRTI